MTDQLQRTTRLPSIRFTVDEGSVLLGLLELLQSERPDAFGELSDRMAEKIRARLAATVGNDSGPVGSAISPAEVAALRLGRLLESALTDVAYLVELLETGTASDDRPVILMGSAAVAARALARRIDELGVGPVIDLWPNGRS